MDPRHRYIATIVEDAFGVSGGMVDAVVGEHMDLLNNFLSPAGPRTVYFMYQPELREGPGGELLACIIHVYKNTSHTRMQQNCVSRL